MLTIPFVQTRNQRLIRNYQKTVQRINALEPAMLALSDEQLAHQTLVLRTKLQKTQNIHAVVEEAFATVREAARRVVGMRHYDVQLIGGLCLVEGKIPEMRTGEGKTLVATLAAYTLALWGKGVHVVTVNPYLAQRDASFVEPIHDFLGLRVDYISSEQEDQHKRQAYLADITYGTNSEFGFDFLRDNLVQYIDQKVQRGHFSVIVDEVDSVLIDEARTPLIISGMSEQDTELLPVARYIAQNLKRQKDSEGEGDVYVDEKEKRCILSENGLIKVEELLTQTGVLSHEHPYYQQRHLAVMGFLDAALRAHHLYHKDIDYILQNDEIIIVDPFTGRLQLGRRWSDGLHQAIEVKENVTLQGESITLSSITYQNYFRMYQHLSGMTGTADTEAREFYEIYQLETVVVPTNKAMIRKDEIDVIYATNMEKMCAVVDDIITSNKKGQPVLVGTTSVEQSELLSRLLTERSIAHEVLNAKNHKKEATIIAQAGRRNAVTIATNMAGRGTDIILGGNPTHYFDEMIAQGYTKDEIDDAFKQEQDEVKKAGGLRVIGTERHEARRVDNQLRGRSGRQGDAGSSRFYLSLEDHLLRIFGGEKMLAIVQKMGMKNGEALSSSWLSRSIENAQKKVENQHYDVRKQLLEYDNVANAQRMALYSMRDDILQGDLSQWESVREDTLTEWVRTWIPEKSMLEEWNIQDLEKHLLGKWGIEASLSTVVQEGDDNAVLRTILDIANTTYQQHLGSLEPSAQHQMLQSTILRCVDYAWQQHINNLDHLREGIHLRAYAQQEPKNIYKKEAFELFKTMINTMRLSIAQTLQLSRRVIHIPSEVEDTIFCT